ncbi:hypothetical protein BESB_074230 [Besnoitia besnoiti]|uniref:Transmembrane protein n=1 Tax=Besnoitia besnoiti TaxID=94643 RepID=A0A2A9MDA1_BESBE|nr:uncharacterized protein BESB_074230 [Besnoitia besnoiti]PFH34271.1 hypothetical protein BESB_074230 [Besnoitia besnoiti]
MSGSVGTSSEEEKFSPMTNSHPVDSPAVKNCSSSDDLVEADGFRKKGQICSRLINVLKGRGAENDVLASRARAVLIVGLVSLLVAAACAALSIVTAYRRELYAYGVLELLLAGLVLFFACQASLYQDPAHSLLFAASSLCMAFLQLIWIAFGAYTVITVEEEISRVDDTGADPADLLVYATLRILQCLLAAIALLSYIISACVGFRLREFQLQPPIVIVAAKQEHRKTVRLEPPFEASGNDIPVTTSSRTS